MRIMGRRKDGVLLVDLDGGIACAVDLQRQTYANVDRREAENPAWEPVARADASELRLPVQQALDKGKRTALHLMNYYPTAETHRALYERAGKPLSLEADKAEHPFTYCKEHVIPAMREKGNEPDDPDAFCAWWKENHGGDAKKD